MSNKTTSRVTVVGDTRTPFAKAGTTLKDLSALELAAYFVTNALEKQNVKQI